MNEVLIFLLFFAVAGIVWGLVEAKVKGRFGEYKVSSILSSLPRNEYRILNNVMLLSSKGTTQIDHIVVSVYGIFVIETKNYKGWITGGERSEQWTKNVYGKKYRFYNPLRQNYGHIKTLQSVLNVPESAYVSIVAFSPKSTIKVKTTENVVYYSKIKSVIKRYNSPIIAQNQLDILVSEIQNANVDSKEMRKEHINNINNRFTREGICPRCGGVLLERNGKYGKFLGCSNYPKCKFTKK